MERQEKVEELKNVRKTIVDSTKIEPFDGLEEIFEKSHTKVLKYETCGFLDRTVDPNWDGYKEKEVLNMGYVV